MQKPTRRQSPFSVDNPPSGGADDDATADPPPIPDLPAGDALEALTEQEARDLHESFRAAREARRPTARTQAQAEEITGLTEAMTTLAGHVRGLRTAASTLDADDGRTDAALPPTPDSPAALETAPPAPAEPGAPAPVAGDGTTPPEGGADALPPAGDTPAGADGVPVAVGVTAAADAAAGGAVATATDGTPALTNRPRGPVVALRAAAGQQTVRVGEDIDMGGLARIMSESTSSIRPGPDGASVKAYFASLPAFEEMGGLDVPIMGRNHSAEENTELAKQAWKSMQARLPAEYGGGGDPMGATAAICEPFDIIRQIPDCVTAAEPFADSLPGRPIGRLAFQFMPSASIAEAEGGVTTWDETDQAGVNPSDPDTWKPCVFIECPDIDTVVAEAVSACVYFDITTEMSSPERVEDIMRKIAAVAARVSEQRLMALARQFTHNFAFDAGATGYGAVPVAITAVLTTLEQGWAAERLEEGTLYQWYVPSELVTSWVIDLVGRLFNEADITDVIAYVESKIRAAGKNVRIIKLLDASSFPPLPALPTEETPNPAAVDLPIGLRGTDPYQTLLLPPEGMLYGSTGAMATGVERSPELMRRNQAQWFQEKFHLLAKHGCQPWYSIDLTSCENGARAAGVDPFVCNDVGAS